MQTYEGYIENGEIFPIGQILRSPERRKVKIIILDESIDDTAIVESKTQQERWERMEKWRGTVRSDIDEKTELAEARAEKYG